MNYPPPLQSVIDELGRLPGVGPKSAQRLAFWLLRQPADEVDRLAASLQAMKATIDFCTRCCNIAEMGSLCLMCADGRREAGLICVVEDPRDVAAIERSGAFRGTYHVLHGLLNPLEGVTVERLKVRELLTRLRDEPVREVILGFSPTVEGDTTALFLARTLADVPDLVVTRPVAGLPVGGDLEFADDVTIGRAFEGRRSL